MGQDVKKKLPAIVAEQYDLRGMAQAGQVQLKGGKIIDLSTISLEQAKKLAEDESFRYLVKKPGKPTEDKKASSGK